MTDTSPEGGLVPNPRYQALQQTLARVRQQAAELEAALDPPFRQFTGQAVWVGQTARQFADELSSYRRRLKIQADKVIANLEAEIRATPQKVPPAVAQEEASRLSWTAMRG
jgi:site-specific recombinase XerC